MPRLTNPNYLLVHQRLRTIWLEDRPRFAHLNPREQWHIHVYFRPSEDLRDEVLLEHREQISELRPSLPQQAGRAMSKLRQGRVQQMPVGRQATTPTRRGKVRRISVRSVIRPKPDLHKLALALLSMAREQAKEDLAVAGHDVVDTPVGQM